MSGMKSYTGPATIDGHEVDAVLQVEVEPVDVGLDPNGMRVQMPHYSWRGTLQLHEPARTAELLADWFVGGRRTLTLPDGRTSEVVQTSVDSSGRVEIEGLGPAPWWTEAAA